jgi:hypothetical protein
MKKSYRLVLEINLDDADEANAILLARSHFRRTGPASAPVNWNRIAGKWRKITAEDWIPDAEKAIMELIDANDLLDEAGIEVTSVSCGEIKPEKTRVRDRTDSKAEHPVRIERPSLKQRPFVEAPGSHRNGRMVHRTTKNNPDGH